MGLAFAIGKFDGLHRAHAALIERAASLGEPCLLRFSGMAEELGWSPRAPLLSDAERSRVLADLSTRLKQDIHILDIPFAEVRRLDPAAFIEYIQERHPFSALVTGDNFEFGHQRSGNVASLHELAQRYQFRVETVAGISEGGSLISSSRIRAAIEIGDCVLVQHLLGRPYALDGIVGRGEQRGRQLGFPTANLQQMQNLIPASGVYAARVRLGHASECIPAAVNVGCLPSISAQRPKTVEAHLIDWSGDCYDQPLSVYFEHRLRDEQRFADLAALKQQIALDVEQARSILS